MFPDPPYYAVIFTSTLTDDTEGYDEMADLMVELASKQDGFLGYESAREKVGITISYWRDGESIKRWRENSEHLVAQNRGFEKWYRTFVTRVCLVERHNFFVR